MTFIEFCMHMCYTSKHFFLACLWRHLHPCYFVFAHHIHLRWLASMLQNHSRSTLYSNWCTATTWCYYLALLLGILRYFFSYSWFRRQLEAFSYSPFSVQVFCSYTCWGYSTRCTVRLHGSLARFTCHTPVVSRNQDSFQLIMTNRVTSQCGLLSLL